MPLTVEKVFDGVRAELGDPEGEFLTNARIAPFYESAYQEAITALRNRGVMRLRAEVYHVLPAYTNILTPLQLGVTDILEPEFVWERGGLTMVAVQSTTAATPVVVTAIGHPFNDGDEVFLSKVGTEVNGRWFVDKLDADTFSLNGSTASVAYTPPDGKAVQSREQFLLLEAPVYLSQRPPMERLREYVWDGVFRFVGATTPRQLKISYYSNGEAPASGVIGIEGIRNFLIARTAQKAAGPGDQRSRAGDLSAEANYHLAEFVAGYLRSLQRITFQPPPYRRRARN
ncbi:MAG TPA: hypothetical protein PK157_22325 [Bryobacteraceae bacterium]|nr:hypothetical protein [Bryobacteraceae bacterium]